MDGRIVDVHAYLTKAEYTALVTEAQRRGVTVSTVLSEALATHLQHKEKGQQACKAR